MTPQMLLTIISRPRTMNRNFERKFGLTSENTPNAVAQMPMSSSKE